MEIMCKLPILLRPTCHNLAVQSLCDAEITPWLLGRSILSICVGKNFSQFVLVAVIALYSITKHAMRTSADEIGATSISFRSKVFSDPGRLLTEFFPPTESVRQDYNGGR
jgi:hypothetical protein